MLSVGECRKYLKDNYYTDEEVEEIRDSLCQAAELLIGKYTDEKKMHNKKIIEK